ncbi:hypothetical protein R1flu_004015, partial [Riccia fluitans]
GCNMASQCCNTYEYCVSCCLDPSRVTAGTSSTLFEYCTGRRRHNSASVVHENAYVSDEHHYFVPKEQYPVEYEEADRGDTDFEDLTIVISRLKKYLAEGR